MWQAAHQRLATSSPWSASAACAIEPRLAAATIPISVLAALKFMFRFPASANWKRTPLAAKNPQFGAHFASAFGLALFG